MRLRKAQLAKALDYSKARITQFAAQGMPFDASGMIELAEAQAWIKLNVDPVRQAARQLAAGLIVNSDAAQAEHDPQETARRYAMARHVYERVGKLVLLETPLAAVIGIADAGGTREMAERAIPVMQMALWDILELDAKTAEIGFAEDAIRVPGSQMLDWPRRINWDVFFDADGRSIVTDGARAGGDGSPGGAPG